MHNITEGFLLYSYFIVVYFKSEGGMGEKVGISLIIYGILLTMFKKNRMFLSFRPRFG